MRKFPLPLVLGFCWCLIVAPPVFAVAKAKANRAATRPPAEAPAATESPRRAVITRRIEVPVRAGQSPQSKPLKVLVSGDPLTVVSELPRSGLALVKLDSGEVGWIPSRYLDFSDPAAGSTEPLAAPPDKTPEQLQAELQRQTSELNAIRQAAANALQIQVERDRLQETVIAQGRELEALRRENHALASDQRQSWFFIGAGVLFGGIVLGLLLPRLSWRKRSSWDRF